MDVREKSSNGKRLIDANALHRKVKTETNPYGKPTIDYDSGVKVLEWIDKAPTIDAVKVVRCRDCKHRYSYSWCEYVDDDDNFYCARGKRKDGDSNG